jgi:eukaryotic-like serine/threonine-protein kinase
MKGDFPREFGPYELLRSLGRGGMAEVFLAQAVSQEGDQRLVALKRMHAGISEDNGAVEMLKAEAQLAMRFDHSNIAAVFELGCHDSAYYFLMEYVDGIDVGSLQNMVEASGTRTDRRAVAKICAGIARGLDYAHELHDESGRKLGIVHRDVSPQNVLINRRGEVKLIDFGVAKVATRIQQTMAGIIKGKYAYMSPEQASAETVDARSDVFSLGICMHELLTGNALFRGPNMASPFAILRAVREDPIAKPHALVPEVGPDLSAICLRALERNLDERFPSAAALADDLEKWLQDYAPDFGDEALADYVTSVVESAPSNLVPQHTIATPPVALMTGREFAPSTLSVVARSPHAAHTLMHAPKRRSSGRVSVPSRAPLPRSRNASGGLPVANLRPRVPTLHAEPMPLPKSVSAAPIPRLTTPHGQIAKPPTGLPSRRAVLQFLWVGLAALVFTLGWSVIATILRLGSF